VHKFFRPLVVLALAGSALGLAPSTAPASAASAPEPLSGPCIPGDSSSPTCQFEYGTVKFVADGDTLDVVVDRSSQTPGGTLERVRMIGVNAMEQHSYSSNPAKRTGECHALRATAHLEAMTPIGSRVRLAAQDLGARTGDRYRRSVAYASAGTWSDAGSEIMKSGDALWLPNSRENAWNEAYNLWAQQAAQAAVGLWDDDRCGSGPYPGTRLQVYAQWDADGTDGVDLNGEYVRVRNRNSYSVDLSGWWVRDSFLRGTTVSGAYTPHPGFVFPSGTVVRPGKTITLFVGSGRNTTSHFYWRQDSPVFENAVDGRTVEGDGAYLFDPQGDLREASTYPCANAYLCKDPLDGKVVVSKVVYDAPGVDDANVNGEFVKVTVPASAGGPVDLQGYQVVNFPYVYDFYKNSVLKPGESITLSVGRGTSTRLHRYWNKASAVFNNGGETVRVDNYRGHTLSCKAWGTARC